MLIIQYNHPMGTCLGSSQNNKGNRYLDSEAQYQGKPTFLIPVSEKESKVANSQKQEHPPSDSLGQPDLVGTVQLKRGEKSISRNSLEGKTMNAKSAESLRRRDSDNSLEQRLSHLLQKDPAMSEIYLQVVTRLRT